MEETVVVQGILPFAVFRALQADADALAECPNFWVPREVVEGSEPARTAAEQACRHLFRRLASARLAPLGDGWRGAEYWCQVYEGGRGLGFHFDKDEHAMKEGGRMANPLLSSVLYLTGGGCDEEERGLRQAPTVLIDQWYDHARGRVAPDHPAFSALVFPRANQYCLFSGTQAHGVLEAMAPPPAAAAAAAAANGCSGQAGPGAGAGGVQQEAAPPIAGQQAEQQEQQQRQRGAGQHQRRVTFLVNWWPHRPENVGRATLEDVRQGRLAAARQGLGCGPHADAGSADGSADGSGRENGSGSSSGEVIAEGQSRGQGQGEGQGQGLQQPLAALSLAEDTSAAAGGACKSDTAGGAAGGAAAEAAAAGQGDAEPPLRQVQFVRVEAPPLAPGSVLPLDELLLDQAGLRLSGPGAADAVLVCHPGLTLLPLDEDAADPACPLQVLAALLPTADLQSDSSSGGEEEGGE